MMDQSRDARLGSLLKVFHRGGLYYDEIFSPVVRPESVRSVIALSCKEGLKTHQMDITTAFLNGDLEEMMYIYI